MNKKKAGIPKHLSFPEGWEWVDSRGAGRFVTQVRHQLPNGDVHVWSSRRHRKARGPLVCGVAEGVSLDDLPAHTKRKFCFWGWRYRRLSWWIGIIFILGSLCFVVGTTPFAYGAIASYLGLGASSLNQISFAGSVCFTIGSYMLLLEAINVNPDVEHDFAKYHPGHADAGELLASRTKARFRWCGWAWQRIDFRIALIQLCGAIIFNINCGMSLVSGMPWFQQDLFVWTPSAIASCCFVAASYLGIVEVCHRWWDWLLWDVSWWVNLMSLFGSIGFLTSSVFGYFGEGPVLLPQWWGDYFSLMLGSWFFLLGTYLLVPEVLMKDTG